MLRLRHREGLPSSHALSFGLVHHVALSIHRFDFVLDDVARTITLFDHARASGTACGDYGRRRDESAHRANSNNGGDMLLLMTLDDVITKMYSTMSFEAGGEPDWNGQSDVFAPQARLVRVRNDGVFEFDPASFRADYEAMIRSGGLKSFFERELSRETQVYGDIAHVLSAYEIRSSGDGEVISRAMKSIQLF